ncbi:hypothetical protein BZG36_02648 [Bifiguratus adelaidae]|uniref:Uncharacterized protein n=1 Tax=Bifiguratus adelaidae TaxID=1938954 RepID=A0A261Y2V1_9FUNG|nr:hypothetical protein BZG36_02648 [Bifiguratus adelaidae]
MHVEERTHHTALFLTPVAGLDTALDQSVARYKNGFCEKQINDSIKKPRIERLESLESIASSKREEVKDAFVRFNVYGIPGQDLHIKTTEYKDTIQPQLTLDDDDLPLWTLSPEAAATFNSLMHCAANKNGIVGSPASSLDKAESQILTPSLTDATFSSTPTSLNSPNLSPKTTDSFEENMTSQRQLPLLDIATSISVVDSFIPHKRQFKNRLSWHALQQCLLRQRRPKAKGAW